MARIKLIRGAVSEVMRSEGMRHLLGDLIGTAEDQAVASAPVGKARTDKHPGAYRASISSRVEVRGDRAVGILSSNSPYAWVIESRTGHLSRALGYV